MLGGLVQILTDQFRVLQTAWPVITAVMIAVTAVIWRLFEWRYAAKNDTIELYKAKLDGATPEEAQKRIQNLEAVVKKTIGSEWPSLTSLDKEKLSDEVAKIEKRRIQVMYLNLYGKNLAKGIAEAFEKAGWDVHFSMGGGFEDGLFVGRSPTIGPQICAAIQRVTHLNPIYEPPNKSWGEDTPNSTVYVAVGTNSN